jgi:hypothetical protein
LEVLLRERMERIDERMRREFITRLLPLRTLLAALMLPLVL